MTSESFYEKATHKRNVYWHFSLNGHQIKSDNRPHSLLLLLFLIDISIPTIKGNNLAMLIVPTHLMGVIILTSYCSEPEAKLSLYLWCLLFDLGLSDLNLGQSQSS